MYSLINKLFKQELNRITDVQLLLKCQRKLWRYKVCDKSQQKPAAILQKMNHAGSIDYLTNLLSTSQERP